ncbi:hypothetical protein ACC691_41615, partial [Rhizobium johnstonii]|uniref:hypothetical protein n=1 Tax=Rhizobium johnstonii TaxID=3019933 RepID=UPI003F9A9959
YSLALELLPGLPFPVALIARYEPFAVHAPAPDSQAGDSTHLRDDLAAAYPTADIIALPGPGLVARVVVTGVTTYVE